VDDAELNIANAVGEVLALAPGLSERPSGAYLKQNLRRSVEECAAGNHSHFARMAGVSLDSIYRWLHVNSCVRLDSFLRMCGKLKFPAARFLSEYIPANDPDWAQSRDIAQQISRHRPKRPASFYPQRVPERVTNADPSGFRTQDSLRERFERVLCEPGPRALQAIAKDLGVVNCSSLYSRCPDLCRAMVLKNRRWRQQEDERIREAIMRALEENPAPSLREVAARLGHSVIALRRRFPALSTALAARIPERRQFERERLRELLQSALTRSPAASMKEVARFIGKTGDHLRTLFPEICRQITDRYFEEKRRASAQRKLRFYAEVRSAVADLCERGINPSRTHVWAAIINPSIRGCHTLDRQIARTLRELEAASRNRGTAPAAAISPLPYL
jgi:AraC-like DNA-binding protein